MSLIVAIEPDRRQASRLARVSLDAELIVADSTERAFELLGGRVPELILTSLLLSPNDGAALAPPTFAEAPTFTTEPVLSTVEDAEPPLPVIETIDSTPSLPEIEGREPASLSSAMETAEIFTPVSAPELEIEESPALESSLP